MDRWREEGWGITYAVAIQLVLFRAWRSLPIFPYELMMMVWSAALSNI